MLEDIANPFKNPLSNKIWQRISQIVYSSSNKVNSDFTSPKELIYPCGDIALMYTKDSYEPPLKDDADIVNNAAFGVYFFLVVTAAQVYLQERAIKVGEKPFLIRQNAAEIVEAGKRAFLKIKEGNLPEAPDDVISKIFDNVNNSEPSRNYDVVGP